MCNCNWHKYDYYEPLTGACKYKRPINDCSDILCINVERIICVSTMWQVGYYDACPHGVYWIKLA